MLFFLICPGKFPHRLQRNMDRIHLAPTEIRFSPFGLNLAWSAIGGEESTGPPAAHCSDDKESIAFHLDKNKTRVFHWKSDIAITPATWQR